jgi:hypothetical protein
MKDLIKRLRAESGRTEASVYGNAISNLLWEAADCITELAERLEAAIEDGD